MDVKVTIAPGKNSVISGGDFIYCREASHNVFDIQPEGSGERIEFHLGAEERYTEPVDQFRVYNMGVTDLEATFRVKTGGTYQDHRVVISGGVDVQNFPATFPDGETEITRKGYSQIGASHFGATAPPGATTLVAPASNTNGMILRTASFDFGSQNLALFADVATGASWDDFTKRAIFARAAGGVGSVNLQDIFIPAGSGLFLVNSGTVYVRGTYDLL